jgi:hypothetical protein
MGRDYLLATLKILASQLGCDGRYCCGFIDGTLQQSSTPCGLNQIRGATAYAFWTWAMAMDGYWTT